MTRDFFYITPFDQSIYYSTTSSWQIFDHSNALLIDGVVDYRKAIKMERTFEEITMIFHLPINATV